jgi:hypothetical protein
MLCVTIKEVSMPLRTILFLSLMSAMGSAADDQYVLHENIHANQKITLEMTSDYKVKSTARANGKSTTTDTETGQNWKVNLTILEAKDGSTTRSQAAIDPSSFDMTGTSGAAAKKSDCPFAGKAITLARLADESFTNDFHGEASSEDANMLNDLLTPDEDYYPDKPVAVGNTWDASEKVRKHIVLGPNDQLLCQCKLDWVKMIAGKQMAQVSYSMGIVAQEAGNVEEDMRYSAKLLVDIAAGMIVRCDEKGSSTYSTPPGEATQVSGGTEFAFHSEVLSAAASTKPSSQ